MTEIMEILSVYISGLKRIYGDHLRTVFLYGSYARGDYCADSDIDIMILLDIGDNEIAKYSNELSDVTFDCNFENNVVIMPVVKNQLHFDKWVNAYPFYNSVINEGIKLYAA